MAPNEGAACGWEGGGSRFDCHLAPIVVLPQQLRNRLGLGASFGTFGGWFGMIMGIGLGLLWERFGVVLGSFGDCFGIALGSSWDCAGHAAVFYCI